MRSQMWDVKCQFRNLGFSAISFDDATCPSVLQIPISQAINMFCFDAAI